MTKLTAAINTWPTVKRGNCGDCGNPWWFDKDKAGFVCTTCYKTQGKSTSEETPCVDERNVLKEET